MRATVVQPIDNKVGATMAQILNPMSGTNASLTATLLIRFSQVLFVSAGGLSFCSARR